MDGKWWVQIENDTSNELKSLASLSGAWTGWVGNSSYRDLMTGILKFETGRIVGEFAGTKNYATFEGEYNDDSGAFWALKRQNETDYEGVESTNPAIDYKGVWNGFLIKGDARLTGSVETQRPFELWPDPVLKRVPGVDVLLVDSKGDPRDLEPLSGSWIEYYLEGEERNQGTLVLKFGNGVIRGRGTDDDGRFILMGDYDSSKGRVYWVKDYGRPEQRFIYQGIYTEKMLCGTWVSASNLMNCGSFSAIPCPPEQEGTVLFQTG